MTALFLIALIVWAIIHFLPVTLIVFLIIVLLAMR